MVWWELADGTLISAEHRGSIHQVGAAVQGAPACNGWTFWHVKMGKNLVAIEREAYGIKPDGEIDDGDPLTSLLRTFKARTVPIVADDPDLAE